MIDSNKDVKNWYDSKSMPSSTAKLVKSDNMNIDRPNTWSRYIKIKLETEQSAQSSLAIARRHTGELAQLVMLQKSELQASNAAVLSMETRAEQVVQYQQANANHELSQKDMLFEEALMARGQIEIEHQALKAQLTRYEFASQASQNGSTALLAENRKLGQQITRITGEYASMARQIKTMDAKVEQSASELREEQSQFKKLESKFIDNKMMSDYYK